MSFTYAVTTDLGKIRFEIGDTEIGDGVLPSSANLQDEELQMLLDREGSVLAAAAAACEVLSRAWAKVSASLSTSNRSESFGQSKQWADMAIAFRKRVAAGSGGFVSVKLTPANRIPPIEYP